MTAGRVRLIPHEESFEVLGPDGSTYFYFDDDNPLRRTLMGRSTKQGALQQAKEFARAEQDKIDGKGET